MCRGFPGNVDGLEGASASVGGRFSAFVANLSARSTAFGDFDRGTCRL